MKEQTMFKYSSRHQKEAQGAILEKFGKVYEYMDPFGLTLNFHSKITYYLTKIFLLINEWN